MIKKQCRVCEWMSREPLKSVVNLGLSPLANNLLNSADEQAELFPLEMMYCPTCHNCQLSYTVPPEKMFSNYLYVSSTSKSFREHFEEAAVKYIEDFKLEPHSSLVIDIGSNDGIALKPFKDRGIEVLGIEPATNIVKIADKNGIDTINDFFTENVADFIADTKGKADIVLASNVFAHSDELKEITENAFKILKTGGCFIVEVQYLLDTIKDLTFDNIYHEHVNYWSVTSINTFFGSIGYYVTKVEHINTHGGSIRVYVKKDGNNKQFSGIFNDEDGPHYLPYIEGSVSQFLDKEIEFGLWEYSTYVNFSLRVQKIKENVVNNLKLLKLAGYNIVGYGSPAKATTALNYFGVTTKEIDCIIEDNNLKWNKFLPGVNIPILSKDILKEYNLNNLVIIVMAWNFFDEIKKNNQELIDKGVQFFSIKDLQNIVE